jgi:hypothetical protein
VHRLDRINAKKPAKLLGSKSLTLRFSRKQSLAGFLCYPSKWTKRCCTKGDLRKASPLSIGKPDWLMGGG